MKKIFLLLVICFVSLVTKANDGVFLMRGNQLIPIMETDISVRKEILSIKRNAKNPKLVDVDVYYEFYNPSNTKKLLVGFEATSPYNGNKEITIREHSYMYDFTVNMNGNDLPYKISSVEYYDSSYIGTGIFKEIDKEFLEQDTVEVGFIYVYNFEAEFKHGINKVKHTYTCDLSYSVDNIYSFSYLLTPAMRWANKQIDDFTLIVDMGDRALLNIWNSFFEKANQWTIKGIGKSKDTTHYIYSDESMSPFYIKKGYLEFKKKNFVAKGELFFSSPRTWFDMDFANFDREIITRLPIDIKKGHPEVNLNHIKAVDEVSNKILKYLPYAHHGLVFKDKELKEYYEKQIWYYPDKKVKEDISILTQEEREWVEHFSK